jgi:alpha-beta hydrolase superfamily lysophospholipase
MHEMNTPFIAFHGREDPMTDPESSAMLHRLAACSDKSLQWVDNVFHDLMHEKPISDEVCSSIADWMIARTAGAAPAEKAETRADKKVARNRV